VSSAFRGFTHEKTYDFIQLGGLKEDDAGKKPHMVNILAQSVLKTTGLSTRMLAS